MVSFECKREIITDITQDASPEIREYAQLKLHEYMERKFTESRFCDHIALNIPKTFQGELQREADATWLAIGHALLHEHELQEQRVEQRKSAEAMRREILETYKLIERMGRGVVYLGSARTKPGDKDYDATEELGREVYQLLGSTSWSGAGPGQMDAPLRGAASMGGKVAGVKIALNGDQSSFEQNISDALKPENVVECKYFGPRKIGLVDAAMRENETDRTAIIATPGGFGTFDEFFEYVVLKQLKKLGSKYPVPILIMNYDGFYDGLIQFLYEKCVAGGKIREDEMGLFHICRTNDEALEILAETYGIPEEERLYRNRDTSTAA